MMPMRPLRHSVRAILFDGDEIVLFKRTRPGREPYWITPGGGVEPSDTTLEATLRRELDEELGATAGPALRVFTIVEQNRLTTAYVCRLVHMDLSRRSGPEFLDPENGIHEIVRVRPEKMRELNLIPPELADFIADGAATLPALLAAATDAPGRYRPVVDVHLLLFDDEGRVLLGRRQGTGYADGEWQIMPSGHLEQGESITDATAREAEEELGVEVSGLTVAHVTHHRNPGGTARVGMFLVARTMNGTPVNAEPHKCAELAWFPVDDLPDRMVPYARAGIVAVRDKLGFSLHGWDLPTMPLLEAEAVRAGFEELSVSLIGHRDGTVLVLSDEETDRLPSTIARRGLQTAVRTLAGSDQALFVGADDYVSVDGRRGRRFVFAAPLLAGSPGLDSATVSRESSAGRPAREHWLPVGTVDASRLPHAERVLVTRWLHGD
jgi:8-oxo-dGTP pyrophosphatase MutT (NUDIX family)